MKIGIIGQGFVGSAIREGLKKFYDVLTYDLDETKCNSSLQEISVWCDIVFVCVPTPMRKDGSCDTRILEEAIDNFDIVCPNAGREGSRPVIVVKSTVPPGTVRKINEKYQDRWDRKPDMPICFSPEFLTEANSFEDFKNQTRIIVGGNPDKNCDGARKIKQMFRKPFPNIPIVVTKWETAEMVKYFTNCFLATKVTFANQMYEICEAADIDYDKVCEYTLHDDRIGKSHLAVPGPDGDLGFGGHCFPKDLAAMITFAGQGSADDYFLKAVETFNRSVRTNRDWEQMKGRAVSDD